MVSTANRATVSEVSRQVDCKLCLTRNCPMSKLESSPVSNCNTYREANCAFCAVVECVLNGTLNSPVLACDSFKLLGSNA